MVLIPEKPWAMWERKELSLEMLEDGVAADNGEWIGSLTPQAVRVAYQSLCPRSYYAPTTLAQSIDLQGSFCSISGEEVASTS